MKVPVLLHPVALGVHLFAAVLVGLAVFLGLWQLGSWQDQRDAAAAKQAPVEESSAVPLADALGPDDPFPKAQVGRLVTVEGEWVTDSTLYVAERDRDGATGYWVITPLAVTTEDPDPATAPALLVVRGWSAEIDPRPEAPTGAATLTAWLQPPEGRAGLVDDDRTDDVIPQVRLADAIQHVDQDLYGGFAVLRAESEQTNPGNDGLHPVTLDQVPEVAATTGWRNLLYGVEWWIFAGFALFIWGRWCRDEVARDRAEKAGVTGDPEPGGDAETDPGDVAAAR